MKRSPLQIIYQQLSVLIAILSFQVYDSLSSNDFQFTLLPNKTQCFSENLAALTLYRLNVTSSYTVKEQQEEDIQFIRNEMTNDFEVNVISPDNQDNEKPLKQIENIQSTDGNVSISKETLDGGEYQFCVSNIIPNQQDQIISLDMNMVLQFDSEAKDYTYKIKSSKKSKTSLKLIEQPLTRMEGVAESIEKDVKYDIVHDEEMVAKSESISELLIIGTILTVFAITVLSCFQAIFLKSFLKQKKLI